MKADKAKATRLIRTARGQLDGLLKMIEDDRYCMDVYNQILATQAILKKVSRDVMQAHLQSCVREAFESGREQEKIDEVLGLLNKLTA
ncbi:MAG: metal-sensing transcriptional repressor [Eubacteriales bacterium]|jgi:DNA-binding FrmR family transcriptional regulator|nr:metal-sensing transcriptional repressor [Eubacteriales bacterium]MDD4138983.1 metal-sensing transcriptional repressor [Eubacteriales bacterium]MDD4744193.1 metal-sensing transcriptional repressor [Eubacteriales bacterium]NLO34843.1 metal-sensing transcriptional repressor [Clostridiaceae bacterium]